MVIVWLSMVLHGYRWLLHGYQWLLVVLHGMVICGYCVVIRLVQSGFMVIVVIAWLSVVLDCLSNVSIDSMHDYIIHSCKINI